AGLVAVTAGAGYILPALSLLLGLVAGAVCLLAIPAKLRLGLHDSLNIVPLHLVGGALGVVLVGPLSGAEPQVWGKQVVATVVVAAFAFAVSYCIARGLRGARLLPRRPEYAHTQ